MATSSSNDYVHFVALNHVLTAAVFLIAIWCVRLLTIEEAASVAVYAVAIAFLVHKSKLMFRSLAPSIGTPEAVKKAKNVRKFADQGWQLMIHVLSVGFELAVLHEDNWRMWLDMESVALGNFPIAPKIKQLYMAQFGIWFWTAISHRFLEARHKDYYLMYTHHVVTLFLVVASYSFGYNRIGVVVLFIHDVSDIFIDCLKMANYMGLDDTSRTYLVETFYALSLASWVYFRMICIPMKILRPTLYAESQEFYPPGVWSSMSVFDKMFDASNQPCFAIARWLLIVLYVMHCWWLWLLLRIGVRTIFISGLQSSHAVGREEYEGTSDSEDESKED